MICIYFLWACASVQKMTTEETTEEAFQDADGDGYSVDEDCDDSNSLINPSIDEICDGVDNHCNG